MDELLSRYQSLDEVTWGSDIDEAREELVSHINSWTETGVDPAGPEPDWPWPIDEPPEGPGGQTAPQFEQQYSGLRLCGYHVGKTNGMPDNERRRFLDQFFRNDLPSVVEKYHGDDYGEPGSETRLRKMANVIAANCRNFKKNDREKYRVAIADYEHDLEYLRASYYKAGTFPWPPIEP
jgi:hypothetical protein